jgi:enoyl-CoA hydratase/carnithine racemase
MPSSNVLWEIEESVGTFTFNRPQARNALTWEMYDALVDACDAADRAGLRVFVLRGAGGTFAAGTDIRQFREFTSGEDGIAYERRLEAVIDRVASLSAVSVAVVDGPAVGGGCVLALACDMRLCTSRARFGIPVARTLGNCLSAANLARLIDAVGVSRATDLLLTGRMMDAAEAHATGLASRLVPAEEVEDALSGLVADLRHRARSTLDATKATLRHLRAHRHVPPADEIIARCYGSAEFREGVAAFVEGREPRWGALRSPQDRDA